MLSCIGINSSAIFYNGAQAFISDMDTAIYVYYRMSTDASLRLKLLDVVKLGRGKHEIVFLDPAYICRTLELEFVNGHMVPAIRYADCQRDIKRLLRDIQGKASKEKRRDNARRSKGRANQRK